MRVGGGTIQESHRVKNLGVLFDRHLTWDAHVSNVVRECVGLLIGLRHLRRFLPQRAMLTIVKGLVVSRVRYCLSVYGNGSAANNARLMKVMNFATRVAAGLQKFDRVSRAREELGLRTPRQMCDSQTAIVAHRVRGLGEPDDLASLFEFRRCATMRARHQTGSVPAPTYHQNGDWTKVIRLPCGVPFKRDA